MIVDDHAIVRSLTDTDGIDVLKYIRQARPDIGVIILSIKSRPAA